MQFSKVTNWLSGRHTAFALFFTAVSTAMAWKGKLGPDYVAFVTVMQGWIFAHSYKESKFKDQDSDQK